MKKANIATVRKRQKEVLDYVATGKTVVIYRRDVPIARIVPPKKRKKNRTQLGCGRGTGEILCDLTEPLIPESDWEMFKD
jgi:antitoxin (DNA-binding transcriptional repressor) of toxin-antitoxin stability system